MPTALGGFALVLAVVLPVFVYPRLAVLPADPQGLQVMRATGATALVPDLQAPAGARVVTGADVEVRAFISAAGGWTPENVVNWRLAASTLVNGDLVNARYEDISLDRRTARPVNCCGDRLVTQQDDVRGEPLTHQGLIAFPFDTRPVNQQVWDGQLKRARTAFYDGVEDRDGLRLYRFRATTPLTRIGTMELPGRLFGTDEPSVVADSMYADTRTYWVEPATGTPVDVRDDLTQQFTYDGTTVTALQASLRADPLAPELRDQVKQGATLLPWLRGRASLFLAAAGLLLLLPALRRLARRGR